MNIKIEKFEGKIEDILTLLKLSSGLKSDLGIQKLFNIEMTRGTTYLTAQIDNQIVGLIGFYFDSEHIEGGLEPAQIIDFAVLSEFRKLGVGKLLMNTAIETIKSAGYQKVWLSTDGESEIILKIYESLGFKFVTKIPGWFGENTSKAILSKDLS